MNGKNGDKWLCGCVFSGWGYLQEPVVEFEFCSSSSPKRRFFFSFFDIERVFVVDLLHLLKLVSEQRNENCTYPNSRWYSQAQSFLCFDLCDFLQASEQ
jgi:hypothetical protein